MNKIYDIAVIGAGPIGMMAAFYAGTRGLKPILIDVLDSMGGQCATLYPEKKIYDIAGQPSCTGLEIIEKLKEQLSQIEHDKSLGTSIKEIKREGEIWHLISSNQEVIQAKVIIIAIGKGAFEPRKLSVKGEDLRGVFYTINKLDIFKNKKILIVGGGDSAIDWCLALKDIAQNLVQIHRSNKYRAHAGSINQLQACAEKGQLQMKPFYEIKEIKGDQDGQVKEVIIFDNRSKEEEIFEVDNIIISAGYLTNLGDIQNWGLEIEDNKILVNPSAGYLSNLPNVFAIGDIAHFEGKVELIITGFGEAATTAYYAYKAINGDVKGAAWCAKLPSGAR